MIRLKATSGFNENLGEKILKNYNASSGASTTSFNAELAASKNLGFKAWNFFRDSPRNARLFKFLMAVTFLSRYLTTNPLVSPECPNDATEKAKTERISSFFPSNYLIHDCSIFCNKAASMSFSDGNLISDALSCFVLYNACTRAVNVVGWSLGNAAKVSGERIYSKRVICLLRETRGRMFEIRRTRWFRLAMTVVLVAK